jgi:hypothetical protein
MMSIRFLTTDGHGCADALKAVEGAAQQWRGAGIARRSNSAAQE